MNALLARLPSLLTPCKVYGVSGSRVFLIPLVLATFWALGAQEVPKAVGGSLTIADVVRLAKAGVTDELIIAKIKSNAKAFDLNSDEMIELKNSGVSQTVIEYLLDPNKPYTAPAASSGTPPVAAPPPGPKLPSDPLAAKVPSEPGLYYVSARADIVPLDFDSLVPTKEPGKASKLLGGLLKGHIIGSIVGGKAKTRFTRRTEATFFLRVSEKATIDDYALLRLEPSANRRDLDFGTKPGKPVFPFRARVRFEPKQVVAGLYRIPLSLTEPGEYVMFVLGSGDEKKGILGKGYDFGVD